MPVLDVSVRVDDGLKSYSVVIDGEHVAFENHKARVRVDNGGAHQIIIQMIGEAGSGLSFQIEDSGSLVADGRGEVFPEGEPFGTIVLDFTVSN